MSRPKNFARTEDVKWHEMSHGDRIGFRGRHLSHAVRASGLGCSLYEIPPGRASFPYHYHCANEEAIYVLSGTATVRLAGKEYPVAEGDYISLPVGEEGAHQVINTSDEPVRYLCFSTMRDPEIAVYPDSNKYGLFAGVAPGGPPEGRTVFKFLKADAGVDYFEGED